MRLLTPALALVAVVGLVAGTCTAVGAGTSIADEQPSRMVTVRDVTARPGMVSGVLVNHSQKLLRDVRLLFHHTWLWARIGKANAQGQFDVVWKSDNWIQPDPWVKLLYPNKSCDFTDKRVLDRLKADKRNRSGTIDL